MFRVAKRSDHLIAVDGDMECLLRMLWSWMQLSPHGQAEIQFNNADTLSGAEVWRKCFSSRGVRFVCGIRGTIPCKAAQLPGRPRRYCRISALVAAGATTLPDDEQGYCVMKMLPGALSLHTKSKASKKSTFDDLKEWVIAQAEFADEQSAWGLHLLASCATHEGPIDGHSPFLGKEERTSLRRSMRRRRRAFLQVRCVSS